MVVFKESPRSAQGMQAQFWQGTVGHTFRLMRTKFFRFCALKTPVLATALPLPLGFSAAESG